MTNIYHKQKNCKGDSEEKKKINKEENKTQHPKLTTANFLYISS